MDQKTEELRDIFMDVADHGTVTESQEEPPGSLAEDVPVEERIDGILGQMRERYTFESELEDEALHAIARGFYADRSDASLAESLDISAEDVLEARLDLHLLKDADRDGPIDIEDVRQVLTDGDTDLTDHFDLEDPDVARLVAVVETERTMRRANYRFRDQFDDILGDGDLAAHLTKSVTDDGLEDATEGMEINTGF